MDRITYKLTKYFIAIIAIIIALCIAASTIFLSKFSLIKQYDSLELSAKQIYNSLKINGSISDPTISAVLIRDNNVVPLTNSKMGIMPFLHSLGSENLKTKGMFKNPMGSEFLYYNLQTELGDIVVFQNSIFSPDYLKVIYLVLFLIFIFAVVLSIPLISYIGKKFTRPILKLEKVASSISKGNFDVDCTVNTNDEIELLSNSLSQMAQDLKKKYALQRDFIANVSHDFKTPLSVIRSYNEAISDGLVDEEYTKKYAAETIKEVDRLNALVMDLLQLSKLQDNAYTLNKLFISLPQLVEDCVGKLKTLSDKKNIAIDISIQPMHILADNKYLHRVLYNFIDNAIKFSSENSKIEIFTTDINNKVKLSIKDYGLGIDEHSLEDIWDKYYKNSKSGGMGLGLPICKEILKAHDFEYGVTSSIENGTEFYFLIPKDSVSYNKASQIPQ